MWVQRKAEVLGRGSPHPSEHILLRGVAMITTYQVGMVSNSKCCVRCARIWGDVASLNAGRDGDSDRRIPLVVAFTLSLERIYLHLGGGSSERSSSDLSILQCLEHINL